MYTKSDVRAPHLLLRTYSILLVRDQTGRTKNPLKRDFRTKLPPKMVFLRLFFAKLVLYYTSI